MKSRAKRAFSITELLFITAIIVLVSGSFFPALGRASSRKLASDSENLGQIALATQQYLKDYDGVYPLLKQGRDRWGCNYGAHGLPIDCHQVTTAAVSLAPYMKDTSSWTSPEDSIPRNDCPTNLKANDPGQPISYTFNFNGTQPRSGMPLNPSNPYALGLVGMNFPYPSLSTPSLTASQVGDPNDTVLLYPYFATFSYWYGQQPYSADGRRIAFPDKRIYGIATWPRADTAYYWCGPKDQIAIGTVKGKTPIAWADGHVSSVSRDRLMSRQYLTNGPAALAAHAINRLAYDSAFHRS